MFYMTSCVRQTTNDNRQTSPSSTFWGLNISILLVKSEVLVKNSQFWPKWSKNVQIFLHQKLRHKKLGKVKKPRRPAAGGRNPANKNVKVRANSTPP